MAELQDKQGKNIDKTRLIRSFLRNSVSMFHLEIRKLLSWINFRFYPNDTSEIWSLRVSFSVYASAEWALYSGPKQRRTGSARHLHSWHHHSEKKEKCWQHSGPFSLRSSGPKPLSLISRPVVLCVFGMFHWQARLKYAKKERKKSRSRWIVFGFECFVVESS